MLLNVEKTLYMPRNFLRIHFFCIVIDAQCCKNGTPARNACKEKDHADKHYWQRIQDAAYNYCYHKQYITEEYIREVHIWFHNTEAILIFKYS